MPTSRKPAFRAGALAAMMVAGGLAVYAAAAGPFDVQANSPQVAGQPASDTTAVFPTNKQNEPSIAVNPADHSRLIAGSNDEQLQPPCGPGPVRGAVPASDCSFFPLVGTDGVYTSSDGGTTWTNRGLLDTQPGWVSSNFVSDGDPVIVYGPRPLAGGGFSPTLKRAYYVGLASQKVSSYPPQKAPEWVVVSYSDDDGLTWSAPVAATTKANPNTFNDKNSAWVDNSPGSPYYGNLYVGFTAFRSVAGGNGNGNGNASGNAPAMVARSTDGGNSFGAPNQLSPAANNATGNGRQGTDIATGPDGTVYVAFEQAQSQVVAISRDGGTSYGRPVTMGAVADIQDPIPGSNFRTDSFPSITADPRTGSTTVYASWVTLSGGLGRVVVYRSANRGATWSLDGTLSGPAQGYAFFNGMDIAPNGRVDVGWQGQTAVDPSRFGTGNASINAYFASKPAGGAWSVPAKVSSASSDPAVSAQNNLQRQFWGDYNTVVSVNERSWFIYTDGRRGAGCPAVDAYETALAAAGLATEDPEAGAAESTPTGPAIPDKPAPPVVCPGQFGNTDAFVSVVAP
ncbi:MAG: sialidase family protein [Thermoleophilia bacterium]